MFDTISEDALASEQLKRKARKIRIEANRAAPLLASQLMALAALYEREAERLHDDDARNEAAATRH
jgi:hypothetical protein